MRGLVGLLFGTLWLALSAPVAAADWPTDRADAARSGYTAEPLPERLTLHWRRRGPATRPAWPGSLRIHVDRVVHPMVAGGLCLFASSTDNTLTAADFQTGRVAWELTADGFAPAPDGSSQRACSRRTRAWPAMQPRSELQPAAEQSFDPTGETP